MTYAPARELLQVDRLRVLARRRAAQLALISAVISSSSSAAQLAVEIDAAAGHAHLGEGGSGAVGLLYGVSSSEAIVVVLGHGVSIITLLVGPHNIGECINGAQRVEIGSDGLTDW